MQDYCRELCTFTKVVHRISELEKNLNIWLHVWLVVRHLNNYFAMPLCMKSMAVIEGSINEFEYIIIYTDS